MSQGPRKKLSTYQKKYSLLLDDFAFGSSTYIFNPNKDRKNDVSDLNLEEPQEPSEMKNKNEDYILRTNFMINWLKKRYQQTAKTESMQTLVEIKRNKDIQKIFKQFDEDQSGMLDLDEINQLFVSNGIQLGKENTKEFFKLLDADNSGALSVAEFKDFLFNDKCKESKTVEELEENSYGSYLPFVFEDMLMHLQKLTKRKKILDSISNPININQKEIARKDVIAFLKLFKDYQGRIDDTSSTQPTFLRLRLKKNINNPFMNKSTTKAYNSGSRTNKNNQSKNSSYVIIENLEESDDLKTSFQGSSFVDLTPNTVNFNLNSPMTPFAEGQRRFLQPRKNWDNEVKNPYFNKTIFNKEEIKEQVITKSPEEEIETLVKKATQRGKMRANQFISQLQMQSKVPVESLEDIDAPPKIQLTLGKNNGNHFHTQRNSLISMNQETINEVQSISSNQKQSQEEKSLFGNVTPQMIFSSRGNRKRLRCQYLSLTRQNSAEKMDKEIEQFRLFQQQQINSVRINTINSQFDQVLKRKLNLKIDSQKTIKDLLISRRSNQLKNTKLRTPGELSHSLNLTSRETLTTIMPSQSKKLNYKKILQSELGLNTYQYEKGFQEREKSKFARIKRKSCGENPFTGLVTLKKENAVEEQQQLNKTQKIPLTNLRLNFRNNLKIQV